MVWNVEEFNKICIKKGINTTVIYQQALDFKINRVYYHRNELINAYEKLLLNLGDDNLCNELEFGILVNLEAQLQALHPLADIMAQIINVSILKNSLSEGEVSFNKVLKELKKLKNNIKLDNLKNAMRTLKESKEFIYINAFTNTIKHRTIIDIILRGKFGLNTNNSLGVKIDPFDYGGNNFAEMNAEVVFGKYTDCIIDMICEIGKELNEYLK